MIMSQHLSTSTQHVSTSPHTITGQLLGLLLSLMLVCLGNKLESHLVVSGHGAVLLQNRLDDVSVGHGLVLGVAPFLVHPRPTPHGRAIDGVLAAGSDLVLLVVISLPDQLVRLQKSHKSSPAAGMHVSRQRLGLVVGMLDSCKQTGTCGRQRRRLVVQTCACHIEHHSAGFSIQNVRCGSLGSVGLDGCGLVVSLLIGLLLFSVGREILAVHVVFRIGSFDETLALERRKAADLLLALVPRVVDAGLVSPSDGVEPGRVWHGVGDLEKE